MSAPAYHKEMPLQEWSEMFKDIYFHTKNYGRSKHELLSHLVKVFGLGSHYLIREANTSQSQEYTAKLFAWYCALATRLGIDLERALWEKYPGVCPRCQESRCACTSNPEPIDQEALAIIAMERINNKPANLRQWQNLFASIYTGPDGKETIADPRNLMPKIFSRIAEELGEIAEALLMDPVIDPDAAQVMRNEMADLGAWIFCLVNNLHKVQPDSSPGVFLADIAWNLYPGKCHRCNEFKCICVQGTYKLELAEKGAMGPSHWDDLTGIANVKALRTYLSHIEKTAIRNGYSYSMLFFDLDNFGSINKTYGHEAGDLILKKAAESANNTIRRLAPENSILFRRGGEEFIAVIKRPLDDAKHIAEQVRSEISKQTVIIGSGNSNQRISVTASIGVAYSESTPQGLKALEQQSEERCRQAKAEGKNRIIPALSEQNIKDYLAKGHG